MLGITVGMLGIIVGIVLGIVLFVATWSASSFSDGSSVSVGALTLGVLGAISVAMLVSYLGKADHPGPE